MEGGGKWWMLKPNSGRLRRVVVGGSERGKHWGRKCKWWVAEATGGWQS